MVTPANIVLLYSTSATVLVSIEDTIERNLTSKNFHSTGNLSDTISNNVTLFSEVVLSKQYLQSALVLVFYIIGVFGNFVALFTLAKQSFLKQTKQAFFLRNLLTNNLISLVGMLIQFMVTKCLPETILLENMRYFCISRVVWRYFGLSSGCVAFLMASDRCLSLTKPFYYQKYITMKLIKRAIIALWIIAAILTFSPFFGFGVYFDLKENKCKRYRDGSRKIDLVYAFSFFTFGIFICSGIVICNILVTRVLYRLGNAMVGSGKRERLVRSTETNKQMSSLEKSFIKIIVVLSISFVFCWMPQMISIVLAHIDGINIFRKWFYLISDILMAIHFGADPYFYVILRPKQRTFLSNIIRQSSSKQQNNSW